MESFGPTAQGDFLKRLRLKSYNLPGVLLTFKLPKLLASIQFITHGQTINLLIGHGNRRFDIFHENKSFLIVNL